ncbi:hypothetical protein PTKIN_Ptkin11bG0021300 [Pterospermum kingtungense]
MVLELNDFAIVLFILIPLTVFFLRNRARLNLPPSPPGLPIIGHLHLILGTLPHQTFHKLTSRYGPLIYLRLGSVPAIIAANPDLAREFLMASELSFSTRKRSIAVDQLTYKSSYAFAHYGPYSKFIKRLSTSELVGGRMINQFLPIRTKELRYFLQTLLSKSKVGQTVNVSQELLKLTNNTISQMMLSIRCSGNNDSQADEAKNLVREVTELFGEFNSSDFIWFCKNLDLQGFRKKIDHIHRRYDGLLEKIISDREFKRKQRSKEKTNGQGGDIDHEEQIRDFLDIMLDVLEDENSEVQLTRDNIKAIVLDFLTAATDTTAAGIEWALAELMNHPKVLEKARKEIDQVVGTNRIVQESDTANLPYIQAVIKETLRLHPPIPVVSRKSVEACKIYGYDIPENAIVFVNVWSIGRDPGYWKDPLEFKPERFLPSNNGSDHGASVVDVKGQHFQLLPFGSGRRGCLGMSLAMQELHTAVAATIQCFDFKVVTPDGVKSAPGEEVVDMIERNGLTAPRAHDLVCMPVPRLNNPLNVEKII